MKRFLSLFLALAVPAIVSAQTGLIFHKSHSGSAVSFSTTRFGNFGELPTDRELKFQQRIAQTIREIERLNDSVLVIKTEGIAVNDTVVNPSFWSPATVSVDSLRKFFPPGTTFTNFETETPVKKTDEKIVKPTKSDQKSEKSTHRSKKKERRSDLWMLWIIGGGIFLGIGLSGSRKRISIPSKHA